MDLANDRQEIDHHILKLIVGLIALSLASLTALLSSTPLDSISASYHEGGTSRDVFVGFLFAIGAFLLAYNGSSLLEMGLSRLAAVAAFGVAVFPCRCGDKIEVLPHVHAISAAAMFLVLAAFCWIFYRRARAKRRRQADWRAAIYAVCGSVIVLSVAVLLIDGATGHAIQSSIERLTFYGENASLVAFGISWLVASRVLPLITAPDERVSVVPDALRSGGRP